MAIQKETIYSGKYLRIIREGHWEYVQRTNCTGIVVILPLTSRKETIFVEQYRIPVANRVIEFPAGLAGDTGDTDESLLVAAARELEEETGYRAGKIIKLLAGSVSAGLSSEILTYFLATDLLQSGEGGGDASESIVVHKVPLNLADQWLAEKTGQQGLMIDLKVYAGLYLLRQQLTPNPRE